MKRLVILFVLLQTMVAFAQPANDACAGATPINPNNGCVSGTTVAAADNWIGSLGCQGGGQNPDVWYSFTAINNQLNYNVTTSAPWAGNVEFILVEATGPCAGLVVREANCGPSVLSGTVTGIQVGTLYYITVSTPSSGTPGNFNLCINNVAAPVSPGQDCTNAAILCNGNSLTQGTFTGTGAAENIALNTCFGSNERQSKWYKFTVGCSGTLGFDIIPTVLTNDYDFAFWNTTAGCYSSGSTMGTALACNWSGTTGPTGLSSTGNTGLTTPNPCSSVGAEDCATGGGPNAGCQPCTYQNTVVNVVAGQTYTLLVDNFGASGSGFTLNFNGTAVIGPTSDFTFTNPSCGVYNFTKTCQTTNSTFLWSFGDGTTSNLQNPSHTYVGTGSYTVVLEVTDALGCVSTSSVNISVNFPVATATPNPQSICSGSNVGVALTSNIVGTTFSWIAASNTNVGGESLTAQAGATINNVLTNITGVSQVVNYTVTPTAAGCVGPNLIVPVTVVPIPPVPTISTTAPTCVASGTATVTNFSAGLTYTFTPAGPTVGAGGVISGMTVGTSYTVTAGNGTCTSAASSSFSILAPLPVPAVPTVSTAAPTCFAAGTATITNFSAGLTYTFVPSGPTVGAGGAISGMTAGTNYTVSASNGSCSSAASSSFSIAAQLITPAVPTISTTAPTCVASGTATVTNFSAGLTYTFTPAGPTVGAGGAISGMTAGTSYTVTAGNGTCTSASSSSFSILAPLPVPAVPTVSTAAPTCFAAGTATITNFSAGLTYTFVPAGPTVGAGGAISGMTAGTNYTVSASNGSCSSAASSSFSIAAQLITPAVPTISTTAPTCVASGTATVTNFSAGLTYTFTPAGPTVGAGGAISGMTVGTSYTVTAGNGTCTSAASSSFSILAPLPVPAVPTVSTAAPTCFAAGTATITNFSAGLTYTFVPAGPTVGAGGAISGMTAGTNYTVSASNGSCSSAASSNFSIAAQLITPAVPTISTTAPTCVLSGTATITNYDNTLIYTFAPAGPTVGAGGVISGMTAGTSYTVTAGNGTCTSALSSSFSILAPLPVPAVPTVSTAAPTCFAAGTATITNYDNTLTYTFVPAGPTVGSGGAISGMTAGTNYTVSASNGSCSSAASSNFSIAAQLITPAVPTISTTAPTCVASGTATVTNFSAGLTYTFTPAGPTVGAGGAISGMTVGTSYTVTAGNGTCTSAASSSFSILAPLPVPAVPTVSTAAPTCFAAGTATITNFSAGLTYTFVPAGPTVGAGGAISGMTAGTNYTVSASNGSCSSAASSSFSIAAQLITPAVPTISTTAPTCVLSGTATITNYDNTLIYTFAPAGPTVGAGGVISGMTAGTSYTVTAGNGTCTSALSSSFSILAPLPVPAVPTVSTAAPTCFAAGTATITNYDNTLTYTFVPAGPTVGSGGAISGMTAGTNYTVSASNGSCSSAASSNFSIAAQLITPAVPTISTTAPTCVLSGTATITNYDNTLIYTFAPAGPTVGAGGVISGMTAGTSYTVTAGNGTCTSALSSSFSILAPLPVPAVPTVSTAAPTCFAAGTATITNYDNTLTYTFVPAGPTVGAGGAISGMTAGTNYTVSASNGSCSSAASSNFSIAAQLLTPSITNPGAQTVCDSYTLQPISGTNLTGSQSYWTGAGGTGTQLTVGTNITSSQTVFIYDANGSCSDQESFNVTVNLTPSITNPGNQVACATFDLPTITGTNLSSTPAYYNNSQANSGTVITGPITTSQTVWIYDANGTCDDETSFVVTINPLPTVTSVSGGATYCSGDVIAPIQVAVTGSANWTVNYTLDGVAQTATASTSPISLGNDAGVYIVTGISDANCSNSATGTQTIVVNAIPSAPSAGTDSTYCSTWTLAPMTASGNGGTMTWYADLGLTDDIATGNSLVPFENLGSTTYYVTETLFGCEGPASEVVITINQCDITVPTAFTPDGDGVNENWQILDLDQAYPNNVVRVFNRWGNLIFEHDSSVDGPYDSDRWDGSYNGEALPVGSYYYVIDFNDDDKGSATGTVSILKKQ
jgi:gliding motility-associated-like protein